MEIVQSPEQINVDIALKIARKFNLTPAQRLMYEAMRRYKSNSEHTAYPSISTLADDMQCSRNTAKKYIGQLEDKGLIWVEERPVFKNGKKVWNDTHIYTFVAEKYDTLKKRAREVKKQVETTFQRMKREFEEAREVIASKYSLSIAEEAFRLAIRNISKGVVKHIKNAEKYMEAIAEDLESNIEESKAQMELAKEFRSKTTGKPGKKTRPKKTNFHNFDQRSSKYSPEDINKRVEEIMKNRLKE